MLDTELTFHETMEIHELLNLKTIAMTKAKLAQGIVFDQELKALLGKSVEMSMKALEELQGLLVKNQPQ